MCPLFKSLAPGGCLWLTLGHFWKVAREVHGWYCTFYWWPTPCMMWAGQDLLGLCLPGSYAYAHQQLTQTLWQTSKSIIQIPRQAWQPTVHPPCKPLHSFALIIHQYQFHHQPHFCRWPKYWWHNQQISHNIQQNPLPQDIHMHMMAEPTIHQWVNNCHNHMCNHFKAAKIRAKSHTHDIQQHFIQNIGPQPSTSPDKNLLRPP